MCACFVSVSAFVLVALSSSIALAQATLNPTQAQFTPSADHNNTMPDGTPIVSSYRLDLFLQGASAPFQSNSLGKPTPNPTTGIITVDLTSIFAGWPVPGTIYVSDVAAVGPGGSAPSALSNTFTFGTACTFTASPLNPSATSAGGAASVAVTAGSTCNWTATSNATWITISSGGSGTGNGTVNYTVAANTATTSRMGTITVAGQTATVTQAGVPCSFTASPTAATPGGNGGALSVTVTAQAGCNWTATTATSWITITGGSSGSGNGTVNYTVAVNPASTTRTGSLTVAGQTVTVTQDAACAFTVSPLAPTPSAAGGAATLTVTSGAGCGWTAVSNATWITITSGSSGTANGSVGYNVTANATSSSRTGTMTVAGQTVPVTQPTSLTAPTAPSGLLIKP